jgi:phospholipid/cholesterol/gamma-HCH transport system substrate-binding protein
MKSKAYIKVGILFLATLIIAFWGLNYLKGKDLLSSEKSFYSLYEKIGGLTKSSPVTINGFQVGQVREIELSEKKQGMIEVKYSISYKSIKIPKGSSARIYSLDLMGSKGIALDLTVDSVLCKPNDTLRGTIEGELLDQVNSQMLPLKLKVESLMSSMDSVLLGIQLVFNENNRNNLAESFSSINQTLNNLEAASKFLNEYVKNESFKVSSVLSRADTFSIGLLKQKEGLEVIIGNIRKISDTLNNVPLINTFTSLREVLGNVHQLTAKISTGEGTLGKLIISDSLYNAILATNGSLNRLVEDIRIHPSKYIRISLSDKSKSIYASNDAELARVMGGEGTSEYYICVLQSPTPLSPDNPLLQEQSAGEFLQVGSLYYYYTYHNSRIDPCLRKLDKIRKKNPSAGIFTWVGGKWKRLAI